MRASICVAVMLAASALLIVAALACVIADRRLLVDFGVDDQK